MLNTLSKIPKLDCFFGLELFLRVLLLVLSRLVLYLCSTLRMRPQSRLHLIEFRSTAIFLSPRIKYVSIHRGSKRDLICKTKSHVQFIWIQNWGWRIEVTNISYAITIPRTWRHTKTKIHKKRFFCSLSRISALTI